MRPTLVFIRAHYIEGSSRTRPGEEVPPGTFSEETIDGHSTKATSRNTPSDASFYRLLRSFSADARNRTK